MSNRVFVVGVGMTKFEKPGSKDWDYPQMGKEAATKALADAGIKFNEIKQAVCGYVYGDSTCGQRALYEVGQAGIPVYNVNNNCSTGSTALFMAKQFVSGGIADCVLALGFEKMEKGSLANKYNDRTNPMDKHVMVMIEERGFAKAPGAPQMFGNAGKEHMEKYGTKPEHFAKIAEKNHRHSANNPYSQFRDVYSLDQIKESPSVFGPLTKLQCCPTSDGAAAAVICNEDFVKKHNLEAKAVEILGMAMATDTSSTFNEKSCIKMVGYDMSRNAAQQVYKQTGLTAKDAQVVELHDCFSCNELITYEALGLCEEGKGGDLIDKGDVTFGGKWVVNPSGGLISKGHPLGATGLAQCSELCWQLRGVCGPRQVPNAKIALQHNIGLGGAAVVAMYKHGFPSAIKPPPPAEFNHAITVISADAPAQGSSSSSSSSGSSSSSSSSSGSSGFQSDVIFAQIKQGIDSGAVSSSNVKGSFLFKVTEGPGGATKSWLVDVKSTPGKVVEDASESADVTITVSDSNLTDMVTGKANPQQLFMRGKLKLSGNMALAMKLDQLMKSQKPSKL